MTEPSTSQDQVEPKKTKWAILAANRSLSVSVAAAFVLIFGAFGIWLLVETHAAPALIGDNTKSNCIYVGGAMNGATIDALSAVQRLTGINFNCIEASNSAMPNWAAWDTPWFDNPQYSFTSWKAASPSDRQLVVAQDLIPNELANQTDPLSWEQTCDTGQYNAYATTFAQNLVAAGFGNSVIRLGPEMNGTGEVDSMGATTQEMSAWAQCYVQEVKAMRSVAGANFLFDWNPNSCYTDVPFARFYPGDSYVDIIGLDQYDVFCTSNPPSTATAATFLQLAAEPDGLDATTVFAKQHVKPMSLPQWGDAAVSSGGYGDDSGYVSGIGSYVKDNDVAFQSYFDEGDDGILELSSNYPRSLAAYKAAFATPMTTGESATSSSTGSNTVTSSTPSVKH